MDQELSLKDLIHKKENKYFWLVTAISLVTYIGFIFSMIGIIIILGLIVISAFLHALSIGYIRMNAVKLSSKQFPTVYEKTKELCNAMEIPHVPDIYVMESSGTLNAFATRFFGKNMVVVYSEIFELIDRNADDELSFVIAHELAHIKRKHLSKMMFILPAMWIPGIAEMYLRACEYTCDRYAAFYTRNTEAAKNSLTILAIGKTLYKHVDKKEYIEQINSEKGLFVWLSEVLSTHPPLPKRIREISLFFEEAEQSPDSKKSSKTKWIWVTSSLLVISIIVGAIVYGAEKINSIDLFSKLESFTLDQNEPLPPIIDAVVKGDSKEVQSLIDKGEDIQVEDEQGYSPLHWAVEDENIEIVELLLKAGADPNFENYDGDTSLMSAANLGNANLVKVLIEAGGDPSYQEEISGMTPLMYAVFSDNVKTVKLLLDNHADPNMKDSENMTALMHAIQLGNRPIINLLKKAS